MEKAVALARNCKMGYTTSGSYCWTNREALKPLVLERAQRICSGYSRDRCEPDSAYLDAGKIDQALNQAQVTGSRI
jgi:hypothetical protein